ncbi:MAG TPA: SPFH domain-containing protein [Candidatus Nanopelagicaceae bacterium]|nr:SPFH domain-containing protein [Candidatus Nanopelagicaceae bacterium]
MLFQEINGWAVGIAVTCAIIGFLFIIFMAARYRKFKTNQFVIHLRNGKVKSAGLGGSIWLLPLIDEYIVIPTTSIQTILEAHDQVVSMEYQNIEFVGMVIWKVIDPEKAFSAVSWNLRDENYVEKILKGAAEAVIRTICANMPLELIIRERREIIDHVLKDLHELSADWGILIETFEILEVIIVEAELKKNMEAVKQAIEFQKARIAKADAEQESRMKELQVQNEIGTQEQLVQREIELRRKEKEIAIADKERERKLIEADGDRQKIVIEANAQASAIKQKLIAQAEGEAESIRQQMLAQAEGFQEQVEAMSGADQRFLAVQLVNILPDIFKNLRPDKMFIMGSGDEAFSSLSKAILPFLQLLPEYSDKIKNFLGNGDLKSKVQELLVQK